MEIIIFSHNINIRVWWLRIRSLMMKIKLKSGTLTTYCVILQNIPAGRDRGVTKNQKQ